MASRIYTNLPTVTKEVTADFFETYFSPNLPVAENEYNAILSYFETRADNPIAANALALSVLTGALEQDTPPMEVLDRFKKLSQQQIDTYLAAFINLSRYPTSLLGVSNIPTTSKYVERAIRP